MLNIEVEITINKIRESDIKITLENAVKINDVFSHILTSYPEGTEVMSGKYRVYGEMFEIIPEEINIPIVKMFGEKLKNIKFFLILSKVENIDVDIIVDEVMKNTDLYVIDVDDKEDSKLFVKRQLETIQRDVGLSFNYEYVKIF